MAVVITLIKEYAPWIYGACALVALWYLRVAFSARHERRYAVFSLEREAAMNRTYGAWTVAIALLVVMGLVYLTSTVVMEAVRPLTSELDDAHADRGDAFARHTDLAGARSDAD